MPILKKCIPLLILIACICFTSWKGVECLIKYLEKPKGTTLAIERSNNHIFPSITVCADPYFNEKSAIFNFEKLRNCSIIR